MNFEKIRWVEDGTVVTLKIANGKANTISRRVQEELHAALDEIERREDITGIVITGEGERFFSAGADIREIAEFVLAGEDGRKAMTREERMRAAYEFSRRGQNLVVRLRNFPKPVTARINGMAFGGGVELALGCQRRVAMSYALMGFPEIMLGIIPGWGGTVFLAKVIAERIPVFAPRYEARDFQKMRGVPVAQGLIASGRLLFAKGMWACGVVDEIFAGDPQGLIDWEKPVAPGAARVLFAFVKDQQERAEEEALEEEARLFADLCLRSEAAEGIRAFLEKREPRWS